MNTKKKLLALILAVVMVISQIAMVSVSARGIVDEEEKLGLWHEEYASNTDYCYGFVTDEDVRIYEYYGEEADLVIPQQIDGYNVVEIYDDAFYGNETLNSVVVPDGVQYVGSYAFNSCANLTSITLPEGILSIGSYAFDYTGYYYDLNNWEDDLLYVGNYLVASIYTSPDYDFDSDSDWWDDEWIDFYSLDENETPTDYKEPEDDVVIKDGTVLIADNAFEYCSLITGVTMPDSVEHLGYYAFYACGSLEEVALSKSITRIPTSAFEECENLGSITLHEGIESIEDNAFCYSGLKKVKIPASVQYIGTQAFYGCPLRRIIVEEANENYASVDDVLFTEDMYTLIQYPISKFAISYTVPENVVEIGICSFDSSEMLKTINLSDSVELISEYAFASSTSLQKINFGKGIKTIGDFAFSQCYEIRKIDIPDSVTSIGEEAFSYCERLSNINISDNIKHIGNGAFVETAAYYDDDNWEDTVLYIDNCLIYGYRYEEADEPIYDEWIDDFYYEYMVRNTKGKYEVKSDTKIIASGAFQDCYMLKEVVLPASLKIIDEYAFYGCKILRKVDFGSVETIGTYAFYDCWALEEAQIPKTIKDISFNALGFYYDYENYIEDVQIEDFVIKGYKDTFAKTYADIYGFAFEEVVEQQPTEPTTQPTTEPTTQPSTQPSTQPTTQPTEPTTQPTEPITEPTVCVHENKVINFKAATYFANGYSGDSVCVKCGATIKGKAIAKLTLKAPKFKLTKGKKQFKVKYTAVAGATGFQVRYKLKGKWKIKTFNTKKSATRLIKKLKKGNYSVQVRAFAKQGKLKEYSAWSKVSKVKVK